jgi:hypothetical protein
VELSGEAQRQAGHGGGRRAHESSGQGIARFPSAMDSAGSAMETATMTTSGSGGKNSRGGGEEADGD